MKEFKYVITDAEGIHARPAGELVKAAKEFILCHFREILRNKEQQHRGDSEWNTHSQQPGTSFSKL